MNKLPMGCGSVHATVSKGTHDHQPTGYAGGTPARDPAQSTTKRELKHERIRRGSHTCNQSIALSSGLQCTLTNVLIS